MTERNASARRAGLLDLAKQRRLVRAWVYGAGLAVAFGTIALVLLAPCELPSPGARPMLLAASVAWVVVSAIRLAEGRFTVEMGRVTYAGARAAAVLWVAAFVVVAVSMIAFAILDRLPTPLWNTVHGGRSAAGALSESGTECGAGGEVRCG